MPRPAALAGASLWVLSLSVWDQSAQAAPFTPGNVVVYRVGDGTSGLSSSGAKVFLDEFTPSGTLVQSFAIPFTGPSRLIASGTAVSEGLITISTNGQYLLFAGYNRELGGSGDLASTGAGTVNRVIGRVEVATGEYVRTNSLADFASASNPRSVTSDDGTRFWVGGGTGGVRYVASVGATTSTQVSTTITNVRQVNIFANQLYVSAGGSIQLGTVGTGLPTGSGNSITSLNGFPASGSTYGYFFADLDPNVPGLDTLYVADDTPAGTRAGITKFSLVDGVWYNRGTAKFDADSYRGLTGFVEGTTVTLFATRKGGSTSSGGGELVKLVDTGGYNTAFNPTFTLLATASTNTAFRGVVYIPVPEPKSLALALTAAGCSLWVVARGRRSSTGP